MSFGPAGQIEALFAKLATLEPTRELGGTTRWNYFSNPDWNSWDLH